MSPVRLLLALLLFAGTALGQSEPGPPIPTHHLPSQPSEIGAIPQTAALPKDPTIPALLTQNFAGHWVGQLEYRDFQTNERTFLPTWLTMTASSDGRAVTLAYIYDDGPGKIVRESSLLTLFPQAQNAMLTSDAGSTRESYAVSGLEEFRKLNRGTLTLTGAGKENGKAVDVRITLTLRRNLFMLRKETRPVNSADMKEEFQFRDAYTLTRANPPGADADTHK